MIYIEHAKVYTPYKIIDDSGVLIDGRKIKKVIPAGRRIRFPSHTRVLDAKGRILCPGFIDVHIQGAGGCDFLDGTKDAIDKISRMLARFGTTSYLATTVFKNGGNPHIENIVTSAPVPQGLSRGAQLLGIHLEGPFVNPKRKGMIRPDGISEYSSDYFEKILKTTRGKLRMMTVAPELKGAPAIIKKLRRNGIIASFGHSDAGYEEARKGIDAGITHATHIFNAMRPIHHRDPGGLTAILMDEGVSAQLIADGVHIHPAVIKLIIKLKGIKNIILITDSMSSQGLPDGKYVYDGWRYYSKAGACRYKDGTLIGTALSLNRIVKRMAQCGGVSLPEAIQMATINPARILGIDGKKGSIEQGKDADLVIMDEELSVFMTIAGGEVVYENGGSR